MPNFVKSVRIIGSGVAGLTATIRIKQLSPETVVEIWSKTDNQFECDSYLAQGGICIQKDEDDYRSFFDDTISAGHFSNDLKAVDQLVRCSKNAIDFLINCGVKFDEENGNFDFTKEGGHSKNRILHCGDKTGKVITESLTSTLQLFDVKRKNGNFFEMDDETCTDFSNNNPLILATGGVGGMFKNSTNFRSLTGDAIKFGKKVGAIIAKEHSNQIHPTGFFDPEKNGLNIERCFLISESLRGEGAVLLNKSLERFTDELQPRDILTAAIQKEMVEDGSEFVWLDARKVFKMQEEFEDRFPEIFNHLINKGINPFNDLIPVVPSQHFFQGGIAVDLNGRALTLPNSTNLSEETFSKTPENAVAIDGLWAIGETAYSGVHGDNRLASNSLLECAVWGLKCAEDIVKIRRES